MLKLKLTLLAAFSLPLLIWSCEGEKEETEVEVDCSLSGLTVSSSNAVDAGCDTGGSFDVSATGGDGSYTFSIDGSNFQSGATFADVAAGTYTLTVKDGNDCMATESVTVGSTGGITLSSGATTNASCDANDGSFTVSASGGDGSYEYKVGNGSFQSSGAFTGLAAGSYTVTVKDGAGCTASLIKIVTTDVSLQADIMPIIETNCAITGCHKNAQNPILTSEAAVISSASSIKNRTANGTMPPAGRQDLTQAQIEAIACWVDAGAMNN